MLVDLVFEGNCSRGDDLVEFLVLTLNEGLELVEVGLEGVVQLVEEIMVGLGVEEAPLGLKGRLERGRRMS